MLRGFGYKINEIRDSHYPLFSPPVVCIPPLGHTRGNPCLVLSHDHAILKSVKKIRLINLSLPKLAESIKLNPFFLPKVRTMIPKQGSLLDRDQRHT